MRVFISYQRADSRNAAGRIKALLEQSANVERVFLDTASIPIGHRFKDVLHEEISHTDVVLAIIGPQWAHGRLHDENDFVRYELSTAHVLEKLFVPILVDGAEVPERKDLPAEVAWLVDWQVFEINARTFDRDVSYLIEDLVKLESGQPSRQPPTRDLQRPGLSISSGAKDLYVRGLWVDDHPDNNERERGVLEDFGVDFDLAVSTTEAMRKLLRRRYTVVISDMARSSRSERDAKAGLTLVDEIRSAGLDVPVVIYGGRNAERLRSEVLARGGAGSTSSPFELFELVRRCIEAANTAARGSDRAPHRGGPHG